MEYRVLPHGAIMRRIRRLFFVSMAVMMLAGCGSEQEAVETTETAVSAESMAAFEDEEGSAAENVETGLVSSEDTQAAEHSDAGEETLEDDIMIITVNNTNLTAVMEDNSSWCEALARSRAGQLVLSSGGGGAGRKQF